MRKLIFAVCWFVFTPAFPQSDRGTITGTISITAVVPAAAMVATNTETGAKFETVSTATGNYTSSNFRRVCTRLVSLARLREVRADRHPYRWRSPHASTSNCN